MTAAQSMLFRRKKTGRLERLLKAAKDHSRLKGKAGGGNAGT